MCGPPFGGGSLALVLTANFKTCQFKVYQWLIYNKLTLNRKKSNFVIFRPYQKKLSFIPKIRISDPVTNTCDYLECKEYVKSKLVEMTG